MGRGLLLKLFALHLMGVQLSLLDILASALFVVPLLRQAHWPAAPPVSGFGWELSQGEVTSQTPWTKKAPMVRKGNSQEKAVVLSS